MDVAVMELLTGALGVDRNYALDCCKIPSQITHKQGSEKHRVFHYDAIL